jgi:hypothetical protein
MQSLFRKRLTISAGPVLDKRAALQRADEYLRRFPHLHESFVTHAFPVEEAQAAFDVAAVPTKGRLKVQLRMPDAV